MRSVPAGLATKGAGVAPRRHPAELRMRSFLVVIAPPSLERGARMRQRAEQRLVQQFVTQPAVEALDEPILLWFTGRDVVPADAGLVRPGEDGVGGQLGAVVADDRLRTPPAAANGVVELARYAPARDRRVGDQRQAFAGTVVDHRQDAKAPTVGQLVGDEVEAPALVGRQRCHHWLPGADRALATAASAHRQPLLAVKPLHPLPIDRMAFAP